MPRSRPPGSLLRRRQTSDGAHEIADAEGVSAWLMAPRFHPLLEGNQHAVIRMLHHATARLPEAPIGFGVVKIDSGFEFTRLM